MTHQKTLTRYVLPNLCKSHVDKMFLFIYYLLISHSCSYNFYFYFCLWHKLKIQLQEEGTKIQPPQGSQCNPRGNQEIMPIWGLTFQVTTKLLWITIRPLTPQVRSNIYSYISHDFDCWKLISTWFNTRACPMWIWHVLKFTWKKMKKIMCRSKHRSTILNSQKTLARDLLHTTPTCSILTRESWPNVIRMPTNPNLVW